MSVDVESLREKMKEKGISINALADALGCDPATIYRKLKSAGEGFTVGEMHKIVEVVGLAREEASHIFLFINSQ